MQGLLATQLNHLVHEGVEENSIIRLEKFVKNLVSGRNLVVALKMDIVGIKPGHRLGEPVDIASKEGGAENVPPHHQPQQQQLHGGGGLYGSNKPSQQVKAEGGYNNSDNNLQRNSNPYGGRSNNTYGNNSQAPIVRTTPGGSAFTPIANLNMYQSRWTIRARITTKSEIRTWSNARGEGSLFSIDMLDSSGVDVSSVGWKG
jgi:replication factor A1